MVIDDDGYAPVSRPPDALAPSWPPLPRLRACGATPEELETAVRHWETMSEADRWISTDDMNALSDVELRERIVEGREHASGRVPDGTVSELRAWIGEDPDRARAALEAEEGRSLVRKGLTEYASRVLAEG